MGNQNMNNEEKKDYLNLKIAYQSSPFISELEKKADYISKTPTNIFKYRKFDEFTIDMIENDYVYLAPSGLLDDPFDCLTEIEMDTIYENDNKTLTNDMMRFIVDVVFSHSVSNKIDKQQVIMMIDDCTVDGEICYDLLKTKLDFFGEMTLEQKDLFLNTMINFQNTVKSITDDEALKNLYNVFINAKEKVGVCSFTTKRDNKAMWSLYADTYKGYCIEYDTPMTQDVISNLCPVIYTNEFNNNIVKATVQFAIETIIRFVSNGSIKTNMGCFTELLCTKDTDWEYQDEWRLLGDAKSKGYPFKVKNIYLGFNVTEDNKKMILELANEKGFGVYKMKKPEGKYKISYEKLN